MNTAHSDRTPEEYRKIHDAATAAYEAATPVDFRYSAIALRKAVDAAFVASSSFETPAQRFAKWLEDGPKLAKAAGVYVGIKVMAANSPLCTTEEKAAGGSDAP